MRIACSLRNFALLFLFPLQLSAATYEVGPGKPLAAIAQVPWATLQPGDQVLIHWRATPYREKWVIARAGTAAAPIVVRGVVNVYGQRPIIDGTNAVTPRNLSFWNQSRGLIKFGGSNIPAAEFASHVVLDGLDIRNAYPGVPFIDSGGVASVYAQNAAGVYIERGNNIVIRNCVIQGHANGIFISSNDASASRDILVERNQIFGNGTTYSYYEHNVYTAAIGMTFQFNYFGPLRATAGGSNIKDRSAGLAIRFNWIEGGLRQLDLVDAYSGLVRGDPRYGRTHVYGNSLVELGGDDNNQVLHYGGDSGTLAYYRRGMLYFYNNSVISYRPDITTILRLSTDLERADVRNNILFCTGGACTLQMLLANGFADLYHNWIRQGWRATSTQAVSPRVLDRGGNINGLDPGLTYVAGKNFALRVGSPCVNRGTFPHGDTAGFPVVYEYAPVARPVTRPSDGTLDIGAFELRNNTPNPNPPPPPPPVPPTTPSSPGR